MNGISQCPDTKVCSNLNGGFECRCPVGTDAHEVTGECQGWCTLMVMKLMISGYNIVIDRFPCDVTVCGRSDYYSTDHGWGE